MAIELPSNFTDRMAIQLREEKQAFIDALSSEIPISVRANPAKLLKPLSDEKVPWTENGYYLKERPVFTLDPVFHAGGYYVQEAGSMLIELAVNEIKKHTTINTVLDLCAAPGGKSTHLLSLLSQNSLLVSNEVINTRVSILQENLTKWGHSNVVTTNLDPKQFERLPGFFDLILIDAPCSGEGLFRKDNNAIKEWSESNASNCALRQERILKDVMDSLAPGGFIIYSTCTYNPEENIVRVNKLVEDYGFKSIPLEHDPEWGLKEIEGKNAIGYQVYPHKVKAEGFFISVLQNTREVKPKSRKSRILPEYKNKQIDLTSYLKVNNDFMFFQPFENEISFLQVIHKTKIEEILGNLTIKRAGRSLGEVKSKDFIPSHELALSIDKNPAIPAVNLDKENALQFLRRNPFEFDPNLNGWYLIQYETLAIGWAKFISGRANNKLPGNFRIRNL